MFDTVRRIAAHLVATCGVRPWLMSTADYLAVVPPTGPPVGRVSPVPWDRDLGPALERHGVAVTEEHVAETLLGDLEREVG